MSANPVNAWDLRLLAVNESTFGTAVDPAASQALQVISADFGPNESPNVRPMRDRSIGRGMQSAFISGDTDPIPWTVIQSVKSRADQDDPIREAAFYAAAGMTSTTNVSTSRVLSMTSTPIESGTFQGLTLRRNLGSGAGAQFGEVMRGGVCTKLVWSGGNREVELAASGKAIAKDTFGQIDSITLADGSTTALTITAQESYLLAPGYYICESEIIRVVSVTYGGTSAVIARAQLSSSGVAHTAQPLRPYIPTGISYGGSPISEVNSTCVLGSISPIRLTEWSVDFTTGLDLLPHETSSSYVQGPKQVRYDVTYKMKAVLLGNRVDLANMSKQRANVAVSLSQGTGNGGIVTFASSNCEVMPFTVPDTANDVAIVDLQLRVRDGGTASDALTVTFT